MPPKTTKSSSPVAPATPTPAVKAAPAPVAQPVSSSSSSNGGAAIKRDTQIVDIDAFDTERLIISEPQKKEEALGGFSYSAYVEYQYDDGSIGPLLIQPGQLFCYGVSPDNVDSKTGKNKIVNNMEQLIASNYTAGIPLSPSKKGKNTPEETKIKERLVSFMDMLKEEVSRFAVSHKESLGFAGKKDGTVEDTVHPIYFTKNGEHTLYAPLMYYKGKDGKPGNMVTKFYSDETDEEVDPTTMRNGFTMIPTIKFHRIYTKSGAGKISLKVQLYDAQVSERQRSAQKRMAPKGKLTDIQPDEVHGEQGEFGESGGEE